jgi:hypothetical protein
MPPRAQQFPHRCQPVIAKCAGQRAQVTAVEQHTYERTDDVGQVWGWVCSRATHDTSVSTVGVLLQGFCHILCQNNYQASVGRRVVHFGYVPRMLGGGIQMYLLFHYGRVISHGTLP